MKYMGSKDRLAKELLPIILKDRGNRPYCEPFAGGMNMMQHVPQGGGRFANDNNRFLIEFWLAFLSGWRPPEMNRELYAKCKAGNCSDALRGWAGFNCSYSGKWFGGFAGQVQTKGGLRDYIKEALANCEKQALKLQGVSFCSASYDSIAIPEGAVVYCDPPYKSTTGYHSEFNHDIFWQWIRDTSKNHQVFVSEYNAPEDFKCVWSKAVRSSLSANGKSGASIESVEKLFVINT
jgi:DNA adenine methylase